jgi:hypothetical protein
MPKHNDEERRTWWIGRILLIVASVGGCSDKPFNFNTQLAHDLSAILEPGDSLTTTCTYQNDTPGVVRYGMRTEDEMCFNFVTAYPANLLQHGTAMNGAINPCMN